MYHRVILCFDNKVNMHLFLTILTFVLCSDYDFSKQFKNNVEAIYLHNDHIEALCGSVAPNLKATYFSSLA